MGETQMDDKPTKILIVEDNPDHLELTQKALFEHNGNFEINATGSGEECWTMLNKADYSAIILDYTLPKLDGLEVLKGIGERGYHVPVVMVTGQGDEKIAVEAMKLGACDYIVKSGDYLLTLPFVVQKIIEQYNVAREKERLDQEIKNTKEYLENLLENANDIIYTLDMDAGIIYINRKVEEYGIKKEKLIGKDFFSLLPKKQKKNKFKDSIMEGTKQNFEIEFKDIKENETRCLVVSTFPLKDRSGRVSSVSGIIRDVTETKRLEHKQHEMEIELMEQHKLSSTGTLVQGIAHNMNSPLTGILGRSQLLEHRLKKQRDELIRFSKETKFKGIDDKLKECDKAIKDTMSINENVDRLAGIIKNMMYKSRQEQIEYPQLININELLEEELAFLEADMFFKHKTTKKYNFDESIHYIKAIYSDFSQSILNIIRNAMDAMYDSKEKELTVTTKLSGDYIYVDIHDTGMGIIEEHIPKIFDPFFTTKPSNSSDGSPTGIGLGLHSCYILLKKYGVRINVRSKQGDTTFTLEIPYQSLK